MKIFISDLHMGDGSKSDDFHLDEELLDFLDFVQAEADELVIVGDLFELWQASLDKILFKHSKVIKRIISLKDKLKIHYVVGNHDYLPFIRFADLGQGIYSAYRDQEEGIIAEHGHQYDIFNRYKNPLRSIRWPPGKYFAMFMASLEIYLHPNMDIWMMQALNKMDDFLREAARLRNKITPRTQTYLKKGGHFGEFQEAVKQHIKKGARIVIFGHTHKAQLEEIESGIYANCGAWAQGVIPTYIACHKDRIELKEALTHNLIKELKLKREA